MKGGRDHIGEAVRFAEQPAMPAADRLAGDAGCADRQVAVADDVVGGSEDEASGDPCGDRGL
jgi:hypothetical protein